MIHQDFGTELELRNAARGEHQHHREAKQLVVGAELVVDAVHVVVVGEHQQVVRVGVQEVGDQGAVEHHDAGVPGLLADKARNDGELQREVHQARQVGFVAVVAPLAPLPVRDDAGIVVPLLADDVEVGGTRP